MNSMKKKFLHKILFLVLLSMLSKHGNAQRPKMPFQLSPEFSVPFTQLNKDVYPVNSINQSKQYGLGLKFRISKKWAIGLEGQYRNFNLKENIEATYAQYIQSDPNAIRQYSNSSILNGVLSLNRYRYSKKGRSLFEFGIGGGMQQQNIGRSILAFHNPLLLGQLDTLYQNGNNVNSYLGQMSLQHTLFIGKHIGLKLGVKAQYAPNFYKVSYHKVDNKTSQSFIEACKTVIITQTTSNPITIMPTVGLTYQFGGRKEPKPKPVDNTLEPKEEDKNRQSRNCFELIWRNKPENGKCFEGEELKFKINQPTSNPPVESYKVYYAPFNNLDELHEIMSLTFPSSSFLIRTNVFNSNTRYVIVVKAIYKNEYNNCLQMVSPIELCTNPCNLNNLPNLEIPK